MPLGDEQHERIKRACENSESHINAQNYPDGCYEELEKLKKNISHNTLILNLSIKVFTDEMTGQQKNLWI